MAPYVGFTEAEVHDLFAERKRGNATVVSPKRKYCRSSLLLLFWIRQKSYRFEAETAGLVLYQNHENHLRMEIAKKQEQKVFRVVTCIKGTETKAAGIRDFSAVFPDEYTYRGIP